MSYYYHICFQSKDGKHYCGFDYPSLDCLLSEVLLEYVAGKVVWVNGKKIIPEEMEKFHIRVSDKTMFIIKNHEIKYSESQSDEALFFNDTFSGDITQNVSMSLQKKPQKLTIKNNKVFIVYGHDNLVKSEVARFIEKLGLEAIILHEQVDAGRTIIEKLEKNTDVGFGIVLYTACDFGGSNKINPEIKNNRARQNVVFEHGYLIAKLGRSKVCALVKDNVEHPSDLSGVIYNTMDDGKAWKLELAQELKVAGFDIDLNKCI